MTNKATNFKILFATAEATPFAKTGGLADVAGSLPKSLAAMGNDIRVVMPRYKQIDTEMDYLSDFPVQAGSRRETCVIKKKDIDAGSNGKTLPVYFLENYHYFDRDGIYCHADDGERFAFFCKAILEMLPRIGFKPDIIHCNDWHTGPICLLLKEKFRNNRYYKDIATVFTIHNLEYQGHFSKEILEFLGLSEELFVPDKMEFYGVFNFMKAGILYSDLINTVSSRYAREILTPEYGERLEGLLNSRSKDLYGIVNGISYEDFNPLTDIRIVQNYSADNPQGKIKNKLALQRETGLPEKAVPMLGLITRLSGQKGLELIVNTMDEIMKRELQIIILGEGDPYYEDAFRAGVKKYPDKMRAFIEFNAPLAQKIYAGSDIFLMPSRFEPCGLGQIISLRYGTIPVVRATGGLAETVFDFNLDREKGNGFSFNEFSEACFLNALDRALAVYSDEPDTWNKLVQRALESDFSWGRSAKRYMDLYEKAEAKQLF